MSLLSLSKATTVYTAYDRAGRVIYVGITGQGPGRNDQHRKKSEWWPYLDRQEVEHHLDRDAAARRETELIRQYRPPFNKQGNPGWEAIRAAYLAILAAEKAMTAAQSGEPVPDGCSAQRHTCMDTDPCTEPWYWQMDESCGQKGCEACHARMHDYSEGHQDGWASGRRRVAEALMAGRYLHGPDVAQAVDGVYSAIDHYAEAHAAWCQERGIRVDVRSQFHDVSADYAEHLMSARNEMAANA